METNLGVPDEGPLQDAALQRLAEKEPQYWGNQLSAAMVPPKSVAAGPVRDVRFLDTQTCFWQLALGQSLQHGSTTSQGIPHLGENSQQQSKGDMPAVDLPPPSPLAPPPPPPPPPHQSCPGRPCSDVKLLVQKAVFVTFDI